jgi:hypothetical protein
MGAKSLAKVDTLFTNKFIGSIKMTDAEWSATEQRSAKFLPKRT